MNRSRQKIRKPLMLFFGIFFIIGWLYMSTERNSRISFNPSEAEKEINHIIQDNVKNISEKIDKQSIKTYIANPELYAQDNQGQKFKITAKEGEDEAGVGIILRSVLGHIDLPTKHKQIEISADRGIVIAAKHLVELHGNIILKTSDGYELFASNVFIYYKEHYKITGSNGVKFHSGSNQITANSFEIDEKQENIKFYGNVQSTIEDLKHAESK